MFYYSIGSKSSGPAPQTGHSSGGLGVSSSVETAWALAMGGSLIVIDTVAVFEN